MRAGFGAFFAVVALCVSTIARADVCMDRTIPVTVTDQYGYSARGLRAEDFQVFVNGHRLPVRETSFSRGPRRIVILLDTSDSVTDSSQGGWKAAITLAEQVVNTAPPWISFALLTFDTGVTTAAGFSDSRATVLEKLIELKNLNWRTVPPRNTALLDAIRRTVSFLEPIQPGDQILLITDGGENASMGQEPALRRRVIESGVRVFGVIGLDSHITTLPTAALSQFDVRRIPDAVPISGGQFIIFRWRLMDFLKGYYRSSITNAAARLYELMYESYHVSLTLPRPIQKFSTVRVTLSKSAAKSQKDPTLFYPERFAPCY